MQPWHVTLWHLASLFPISLAQDFGLNVTAFHTMVGLDCPAAFLQMAFHCCSVSPCRGDVQILVSHRGCLSLPTGAASRWYTPRAGGWTAALNGDPSCLQMELTSRPSFLEITQYLNGMWVSWGWGGTPLPPHQLLGSRLG